MSERCLNQIIVGETRCIWVHTGDKGTVVRLWQEHQRNGDLVIAVTWDKEPNNSQAYWSFDKDLKMLDENDEIIDFDKAEEEDYS